MKSNRREILKNMLAPRNKIVAFVVTAFYFLIFKSQTKTSRFHKLMMLQHLIRGRGWFYFKLLLKIRDGLYVCEYGREIISGLRAICKDISLKIGGKKNQHGSPWQVKYYATISGYTLVTNLHRVITISFASGGIHQSISWRLHTENVYLGAVQVQTRQFYGGGNLYSMSTIANNSTIEFYLSNLTFHSCPFAFFSCLILLWGIVSLESRSIFLPNSNF